MRHEDEIKGPQDKSDSPSTHTPVLNVTHDETTYRNIDQYTVCGSTAAFHHLVMMPGPCMGLAEGGGAHPPTPEQLAGGLGGDQNVTFLVSSGPWQPPW